MVMLHHRIKFTYSMLIKLSSCNYVHIEIGVRHNVGMKENL